MHFVLNSVLQWLVDSKHIQKGLLMLRLLRPLWWWHLWIPHSPAVTVQCGNVSLILHGLCPLAARRLPSGWRKEVGGRRALLPTKGWQTLPCCTVVTAREGSYWSSLHS